MTTTTKIVLAVVFTVLAGVILVETYLLGLNEGIKLARPTIDHISIQGEADMEMVLNRRGTTTMKGKWNMQGKPVFKQETGSAN